jgi:hypothetical protein
VLDRLITAGVSRLLTQDGWTDFDSDLDRLLFNIRQDMSRAAFSKSLSKNVARSGVRRAREGRWVCGKPPYGYAIGPDGHLTVGDPQKAEAVRWLFRHYAGTAASLGDLCRKLTAAGIPAPGRHWNRDTVRNLLLNRHYTGDLVWNVNTRGKYSRVKNGEVAPAGRPAKRTKAPRPNDPADYVVVPDAHPALTDRETFAAVGRKLQKNFRRFTTPVKGGIGASGWVLSGMLRCGGCEARMVGRRETVTDKGHTYTYHVYHCPTHARRAGGCKTNRVQQSVVLEEVAGHVRTLFSDPARLEELRAELEEQARQQAEARADDGRRIRDRLAELDKQIDTGTERLLIVPPELQARAAAKLSAWQEERDRLARELADVDAAAAAGEEFVTRVVEALYTIQRLEAELSGADPERARDVLACVVESVTLHFRHGKPRKDGGRRTQWTEYELRWVPDFAAYMDLPEVTTVPVGDWKKYPIGNRTFEEIYASNRERQR